MDDDPVTYFEPNTAWTYDGGAGVFIILEVKGSVVTYAYRHSKLGTGKWTMAYDEEFTPEADVEGDVEDGYFKPYTGDFDELWVEYVAARLTNV